jgi:hypothetical protein
MKRILESLLVVSLLGTGSAFAQNVDEQVPASPQEQQEQTVAPNQPAPNQAPPAPQGAMPAAPVTQAAPQANVQAPVGTPAGQWSYTSQYGWVWMPYGQQYTSVAADGSTAYMYVYYPSFGWRWVFSPWVLGFGPYPYWGTYGVGHFAWYAHPWFHAGYAHYGYYGHPGYYGHYGYPGHYAYPGHYGYHGVYHGAPVHSVHGAGRVGGHVGGGGHRH